MSFKQDIEDAIQAHAAWKVKFRDYLNGKTAIDLCTVGDDHCCKLGQWLDHEGKGLLSEQDLNEISRLHAEFHRVAAEVTHKIKQKDFNGARQDLASDGPFNHASHELTVYLLKARPQGSAASARPAPATPEARQAGEAPPAAPPPASGSTPEAGQTG